MKGVEHGAREADEGDTEVGGDKGADRVGTEVDGLAGVEPGATAKEVSGSTSVETTGGSDGGLSAAKCHCDQRGGSRETWQ